MATLTAQHPSRQSLRALLAGTWADRVLLLLAVVAIVFSWQWIQAEIGAGPPMVSVYHDDMLLAVYPLPERGNSIRFQAEGDIGISEVVIDEHGVHMASSPCTSQRCVLSGTHRHAGDIIACVPNHILVSIRGQSSPEHAAFDALAE